MRRIGLVLFAALLLLGCRTKTTEIRNFDDGKLRIDGEHEIDFYLGNDEVGANPITEQCLAIIGDREPDSVEMDDYYGPGGYIETYQINGAEIILRHYETTQGQHTVLMAVDLEENHVLASGIRIGSTEEALKRAYGDKPEFYFEDHYSDDNTHVYVLYGDWFERYLIEFLVDTATERITDIDYTLDI